jgi:purine-binding chemotaxis protein CheW
MAQNKQFCSFYLQGLLFGVALESVQEVYVPLEMTRVPLAPDVVSGLINLRGQLVTAVDLRCRLELEPREDGMQSMNVVVQAMDGAVSLLVDEIGDVVEVDDSSFEFPPETLPRSVREMIMGVHKLDGHLLHVLDIRKACEMGCANAIASTAP